MKGQPTKRLGPKSLHVTAGRGVWQVRSANGGRATSRHASQAEAVQAARELLKVSGGQLSIHGADGRVRSTYTVGRKAMAKLNAVEGISLPQRLNRAAFTLAETNQSAKQRRNRIKMLATEKASAKR